MFTAKDVHEHLDGVIEDLDEGRTPRKFKPWPWWVRAVATPAALGVTVGIGCANTPPEEEAVTKGEVAESKADGYTEGLCELIGADPTCDLCAELGWYDDGVCDNFCERQDGDCDTMVPVYGVPMLECESDEECPEGTRCVTDEIGECPEGAYCILPPSMTGTCELVDECNENANCGEGEVCVDGICVIPEITPLYGVPMLECESDEECPDGTRCVTDEIGECPEGAYCILPPAMTGSCVPVVECTDSSECPDGQECMMDDGCPEGAYCILPPSATGVCVDGGDDIVPVYGVPMLECESDDQCPEGTECVSDEIGECPEGAWCILPPSISGTCQPVLSCDADEGCGEDEVCVDGTCIVIEVVPVYGVPTFECDTDSECPDGTRCVSPEGNDCPEGAYCILPPTTSGTCQPVVECTNDADCPDGTECLTVGECPEGAFCILPPDFTGTCVTR